MLNNAGRAQAPWDMDVESRGVGSSAVEETNKNLKNSIMKLNSLEAKKNN